MIGNNEFGKIGKEVVMAYFKALSKHLFGESLENCRIAKSGKAVFGPKFKPGTYRIRSRNSNHSTALFGRYQFHSKLLSMIVSLQKIAVTIQFVSI
jgi:hypothetical protein